VHTEGGGGGIERPGSERFEGRGHVTVQQLSTRRQEPAVHDVADAVVREVEALVHTLQHPSPHQFLDRLRGVAVGEPAGSLQQSEVELTAR
jgi:hypothetical protein